MERIIAMIARLDSNYMPQVANRSLTDYDIPNFQLRAEELVMRDRVRRQMVSLWKEASNQPLERWGKGWRSYKEAQERAGEGAVSFKDYAVAREVQYGPPCAGE